MRQDAAAAPADEKKQMEDALNDFLNSLPPSTKANALEMYKELNLGDLFTLAATGNMTSYDFRKAMSDKITALGLKPSDVIAAVMEQCDNDSDNSNNDGSDGGDGGSNDYGNGSDGGDDGSSDYGSGSDGGDDGSSDYGSSSDGGDDGSNDYGSDGGDYGSDGGDYGSDGTGSYDDGSNDYGSDGGDYGSDG